MQRGVVGSANLNLLLQEALNPTKDGLSRGGYNYRKGDRVMQIRNNYDKEVFNGDLGYVESINMEDRTLMANFEDRMVEYEVSESRFLFRLQGVRKGFVPIGQHLRGWICVPQISQGMPSEAIASLRLLSKLLFLDREVGTFSMFSNQLGSACKSQFPGIVRNTNKLYLCRMKKEGV